MRRRLDQFLTIFNKEDITMAFSLDSKIKEIMKDPRASEVLEKYAPGSTKNPQMKLVGSLTLRKLASFPQAAYLQPHLEELDKALQAIE